MSTLPEIPGAALKSKHQRTIAFKMHLTVYSTHPWTLFPPLPHRPLRQLYNDTHTCSYQGNRPRLFRIFAFLISYVTITPTISIFKLWRCSFPPRALSHHCFSSPRLTVGFVVEPLLKAIIEAMLTSSVGLGCHGEHVVLFMERVAVKSCTKSQNRPVRLSGLLYQP